MTMKKAIAGLLAGIVAVSAMATSAFAAEQTFSLQSTGVEYDGTATFTKRALTTEQGKIPVGQDGAATLTLDGESFIKDVKVDGKQLINGLSGITLKITGKDASEATATETINFKKNDDGTFSAKFDATETGGAFAPAVFSSITKMELEVSANGRVMKKEDYDSLVKNKLTIKVSNNGTAPANGDFANYLYTWINELSADIEPACKAVSTDGAMLNKTNDNTGRWQNGILLSDAINGVAGFQGLANQAAAFFHGSDNGTITFQIFATASTTPSTDFTFSGSALDGASLGYWFGDFTVDSAAADCMYIGINNSSTNNMKVASAVDYTNNTITFDISNALKTMNGVTDGNLHSIYYALRLEKLDGLYISAIKFAKADAATEPSSSEASSEAPSSSTEEPEQDANPGTGVAPIALAVIPVALAAAVVVAKKRA